jgi:uncharacterized protein
MPTFVESVVHRTSSLAVESRIGVATRSDAVRITAIRLIVIVLLAASIPNASWSFEVPEFTPNVTDRTGALSASEISSLNSTIARLRSESHIYAAVLIVHSTSPETIEQAAIQTFDRWQLGAKGIDNGLLLLVAMDERRVRIEVGYGLEGAIPDANAKRIIADVVTPNFKKELYFRGLSEALLICNDLVLHGDSIKIKPQSWWSRVTRLQKLKAGIWIILVVFLPIGVRAMAVARARTYSEDLRPTSEESSAWRITLLSGISVFLTLFLVVNPGIFFVQMGPLAAPFLLAFAYLFLGAANGGYLAMFRERWRRKFRANRSKGRSERRPQAFDGSFGRSTSGRSSGSSSSGSSSSGGGRSGGGGASGSW